MARITTSSNHPWTTIASLLDSDVQGKFRLKGFVKSRRPDQLDSIVGLCSCHTANRISLNSLKGAAGNSSLPCSACGKPTELIFNLLVEVSETDPSNFASPGRSITAYCSGLEAERLLGTSADSFVKSEAVRDEVSDDWAGILGSAVQISVLAVAGGDKDNPRARQFSLIESEIC